MICVAVATLAGLSTQSLIPRQGVPVQEILRCNNIPQTVEAGKLTKHPLDAKLLRKAEELAKSVDELFDYHSFYEAQHLDGGVVRRFVPKQMYLHEGMRSKWEAYTFYSKRTVSGEIIYQASSALEKIGWAKSEHLYWTLLELNLHSEDKKVGYKRLVALHKTLVGNKEEWGQEEVKRYLDFVEKIAVYGEPQTTSEEHGAILMHDLLSGAAACKAISNEQLQEFADKLVSIVGTERAKEAATQIIHIFRHRDRSSQNSQPSISPPPTTNPKTQVSYQPEVPTSMGQRASAWPAFV